MADWTAGIRASLKLRIQALKCETLALYLAARHPDTPWYAKVVAASVAAYAFSPIDLIPDFVPVLGYVDDAIIVPLGVLLAIRLVPPDVLRDCRTRAEATFAEGRPVSRTAAAGVVVVWVAGAALCGAWLYRSISR